jgi:hypothetical protein
MVVQHCAVHSTQSVNTGGALAANKSARAMLGPPDTALLHVCGPPRPGVANRPSSGACCVGLGQGQRGAHRRGSRGQRRVTYQRTRLIKPRSASHGKAAAMRARIAGPSSNKAWGREISARLMLLCLSGNGCCRVDRIACAGVENRGKNRKSTKRCGLDRLNLIYAKRAVARPPNGLIRYPRLGNATRLVAFVF